MIKNLFRNPYKRYLKQKIIEGFENFCNGDTKSLLGSCSKDVHFVFEGDNALGCECYTTIGLKLWHDRMQRLLPSTYEIQSVETKGMPWNSEVLVYFRANVMPIYGKPYYNDGYKLLKIVWGKVVKIHIHFDTNKIEKALKVIAASGEIEALLPPITIPELEAAHFVKFGLMTSNLFPGKKKIYEFKTNLGR